jgi:predicted metal-dependent phosphoesterase TrpH
MFKVDLHTHSSASPDGGITPEQYEMILQKGILNCVAITDHNTIDMALAMHNRLGDKIIVGEEIMTTEGEIIGLFLSHVVPGGLTPLETIRLIKEQNGLVYIPHPFESVRKGLHPVIMDELLEEIDIIEVCNGRAFLQDRSAQAVLYAKLNQVLAAGSSDAHGIRGLGRTYVRLNEIPERATLLYLLKGAVLITDRPSIRSLLYPKYHRLTKKIRKHR